MSGLSIKDRRDDMVDDSNVDVTVVNSMSAQQTQCQFSWQT